MNTDLPFAWQLRLSKRAKRPRITINNYGTVELVWPHRMAKRYMQAMLQEHTQWVLDQLSNFNVQSKPNLTLPKIIDFKALSISWDIKYEALDQAIRVSAQGGVLYITGRIDDKERVRQALLLWVKKQGREHLEPWLADVADEMNLSYASVSIRLQKSRWGSCSAKKRLNLNAALLFLPEDLVRHVLIHELTHLKHLNHSPKFWDDVASFDSDYKNNRKKLKQYASQIPLWLSECFFYE